MKVRIPAVISASGKWCAGAYGDSNSPEYPPHWAEMMEVADSEQIGEDCSTYRKVWITVDLPIPEAAEVTGEVETP